VKTEFPDRYRRLGIKIAYYRKLAGLTQAELAERIDKSTAFLGQVEAPGIVCGISLETLFKIARELDIPPEKLLENSD
jgi:hypothetical protein